MRSWRSIPPDGYPVWCYLHGYGSGASADDKYADRIPIWMRLKAYRSECAKKTEFERTQLVKDKTGVKIEGLEAVNPVNGKKIPIFIADYVMMGYGTGAIMAVPAHDQRDYDFAKAFNIDIIEVIKGGDITKEAYTGDGEMVNSEFLNGYTNKKDSIKKMLEELTKQGIGRAGVQFKMKDWAFNRQRYGVSRFRSFTVITVVLFRFLMKSCLFVCRR